MYASIGSSEVILDEGLASRMNEWEFWGMAATSALVFLSLMALLFVWSVARISQPTTNRALPVRLTMSGVWLANTIGAVIWAIVYDEPNVFIGYLLLVSVAIAGTIVIAICERNTWGPRVRKQIPRNPMKRLLAFFFYSGSGCGLAWCAMTYGLSLLVPATVCLFMDKWPNDIDTTNMYGWSVAIVLYFYAYSMNRPAAASIPHEQDPATRTHVGDGARVGGDRHGAADAASDDDAGPAWHVERGHRLAPSEPYRVV